MTDMTKQHTGALRIKQFADDGRIIRGQWHKTDSDGRELACLLGAVGADAAAVAVAVNRAYVARTATWDHIADACLSAIEHELEQV